MCSCTRILGKEGSHQHPEICEDPTNIFHSEKIPPDRENRKVGFWAETRKSKSSLGSFGIDWQTTIRLGFGRILGGSSWPGQINLAREEK